MGLSAAKLRRNATVLFAATPIRSLLVAELAGQIDTLRVVPTGNGIDRLALWGARLSTEHLPAFADVLLNLPRLSTLSLLFNLIDDDAVDVFATYPVFLGLSRLELGANPFSDSARDDLKAVFGERVTFECEREDDYLYRIQNDDPFYNGIAPDGTQYVTRDGANGHEVARFDAAGNVLGIETLAYGGVDNEDDTSFIESLEAREANVRVKRFRHADGRGITGLPRLDEQFRRPSPSDPAGFDFTH